jgi:hypothetical protein
MNTENMTPMHHSDDRLSDLHDAYVAKVNAALDAGRNDLVREFAAAYDEESAELAGGHLLDRRPGRRALRTRVAAPAMSRARESLRRFDRYTLRVMNPSHPYRTRRDRSA